MSKEERQSARPGADEVRIHLIVFKLGEEEYAIRIEQVKEVTVTPEVARMPRTPDFIKGVANIRGDIIAIMDLEERFGIPHKTVDTNGVTYTLVIETENYTIGMLVREVPQSLTINASKMDKTPSLIKEVNMNQNFIDGIAKVDNRLIIVLDINNILSLEEAQQLVS